MSGSSSIPKKDMPIYLQFLDTDFDNGRLEEPKPLFPRYKWCVIEQKTTTDVDDRVRHLCLPKLDFNVVNRSVVMLASGSRIFLIGGQTQRDDSCDFEPNGILSIDSRPGNNRFWSRCDQWGSELTWPDGAALFHDTENSADWICVSVDDHKYLLCFNFDYFESGTTTYSDQLASSFGGTKLISSKLPLVPDEHLDSISAACKVVVGEFVICFLPWSPVDELNDCPALYVYDTNVREWLSQPVQGLPNDGVVLPLLLDDYKYEPTMVSPSLMRVRTSTRKLALVWSIGLKDANQTEVHWTKFTLNKKKLRAENISSGTFNAGNAHLIKSTTG